MAASVGNRKFPLFPILVLLPNRLPFHLFSHGREIQALRKPGNCTLREADVTPSDLALEQSFIPFPLGLWSDCHKPTDPLGGKPSESFEPQVQTDVVVLRRWRLILSLEQGNG